MTSIVSRSIVTRPTNSEVEPFWSRGVVVLVASRMAHVGQGCGTEFVQRDSADYSRFWLDDARGRGAGGRQCTSASNAQKTQWKSGVDGLTRQTEGGKAERALAGGQAFAG